MKTNLILKSREELEVSLTTSFKLNKLQKRKIEILKKSRIYERKYMLYCYAIMTTVCMVFISLSLLKGYSKYAEYISIFISSLANLSINSFIFNQKYSSFLSASLLFFI